MLLRYRLRLSYHQIREQLTSRLRSESVLQLSSKISQVSTSGRALHEKHEIFYLPREQSNKIAQTTALFALSNLVPSKTLSRETRLRSKPSLFKKSSICSKKHEKCFTRMHSGKKYWRKTVLKKKREKSVY